jgi:hypothetical protein
MSFYHKHVYFILFKAYNMLAKQLSAYFLFELVLDVQKEVDNFFDLLLFDLGYGLSYFGFFFIFPIFL